MAADMKNMIKFFVQLYRKADEPGSLTTRTLRQKYLEHTGQEKLSDAQEKTFKKATLQAYEEYEELNKNSDSEDEFQKKTESKKRKLTKKDGSKSAVKKRAKKNKDSEDESDDDFVQNKNGKTQRKASTVKKPVASTSRSNRKPQAAKKAEESSSEDEVLVKKNQPIPQKDSENDSSSDDEPLTKPQTEKQNEPDKVEKPSDEGAKKTEIKESALSSDKDSDANGDQEKSGEKSSSDSETETKKTVGSENGKGKPKDKIKNSKPQSKDSNDDKDDSEVEKMKRFVRTAGIRIQNYGKHFEDCPDTNSKVKKLKLTLEEAGLKGKITLAACKKLRIERETEKEVSELDTANIIDDGAGRSRRSKDPKQRKRRIDDRPKKDVSPINTNIFAKLKDIVDSDSDSAD
ncbi:HIRA-interacting protein 3 [Chamberlinius hualienensis]